LFFIAIQSCWINRRKVFEWLAERYGLFASTQDPDQADRRTLASLPRFVMMKST
jgi:hypothetical protein